MREIYVFGHKNPDTDSVTASIAFSALKNKLGIKCKPVILSHINKETEFVLNYFHCEVPSFLEDVKLQIKDLNYYKDCYVSEFESIKKTYDYMCKKNITGVPVVSKDTKLKGLLTSKMIGEELINGDFTKLKTSYENILYVLNGSEVLKFDDEIYGNVIAASYRSTTFLNNFKFDKDTIMIVGDRHSLIEAAVNNSIKLLIIVGGNDLKPEHLDIARKNKVNIIKTSYDTFHTAKLVSLSNYCSTLLTNSRNVSFREDDYYDEFKEQCVKLGYNNYPVIDINNKCLGLIRLTDINKLNRKQVILVDHNESEQSVLGLREAEIIEIVDHHKIGDLTTNMPINFRCMTVGSTNTIIYSMYLESRVDIDANIAGLMLSGIISDTLKFTSPTTTEYDRFVADNLAKIALIDIDSFADKMFKAGTNLSGKSTEEVVTEDLKLYVISERKIAVSQLLTLNSEEILSKKEKYIKSINELKVLNGYDMFILSVTDIIKNGSFIFYSEDDTALAKKIFGDDVYEGYFIPKCLSRKKQLLPLIIENIK